MPLPRDDHQAIDFVLVHGAWHGSWCWRRVANHLRMAVLRVWTPTLTGLADRRHLLSPSVTLQTHVDDVTGLVLWENLTSVVLVGHSYGGMVISGAVEALGDRVKAMIYLDAFLPEAGQSLLDIFSPESRQKVAAAAATLPADGGLPAPPAAAFVGANSPDAAWVNAKMTPHPYAKWTGVQGATTLRDRLQHKTHLRTQLYPNAALDAISERLRAQPDWPVVKLSEHLHNLMITVPVLTSALLLSAVR